MLSAVQDLIGDYEIIPGRALSENTPRRRYFTQAFKNVREYIQPKNDNQLKDLRYTAVINSASEVREFARISLESLGFSYLGVEEKLHDLAYMIMDRFNINSLNCRMELIYSDKCRRFHVDNVFLRAITTLIGPGTELQISSEPGKVLQIETGDTVLVKGRQFPGKYDGVLHRSPKISHLGLFRVVFVMDY